MATDTSTLQPTTMQQLASAVYPSFAMLAGMQLDVFTPLNDGPLTAAQLADVLGVNAEKLSRLLYALVMAELLTVDGDRFANTPEAQFLIKENRRIGWSTRKFLGNVGGTPPYRRDDSDWCSPMQEGLCRCHPRTSCPFSGVTPGTVATGRDLVARYDFSPIRHLQMLAEALGGWRWR